MTTQESKKKSILKKIEEFERNGFKGVGRPDLPAYIITPPFDWSCDPFHDNNWKFQVHTLRYLMVYLDAFITFKDEAFASKLYSYIIDWYNFNKLKPASFAWQDMATGIRSEKIYLITKKFQELGVIKKYNLKDVIHAHVEKLTTPDFINERHNHGLYATHGLRCLSELLGPQKKKKTLSFCEEKIKKILLNQFDSNYVHKEHSPHYHHLILDSLDKYIKTGFYDNFTQIQEIIEGARNVANELKLPDGREIPFGDTDNEEKKPNCFNLPPLNHQSKWSIFNKSGYFLLKDSHNTGSYVCATNSFNSNIHKHEDNLSFIWGESGIDLIVDPGKYKYENSKLRSEIISSTSHNVINSHQKKWNLNNLKVREPGFTIKEKNHLFKWKGTVSLEIEKINNVWERYFCYIPQTGLIIHDSISNLNKDFYTRFTFDKKGKIENLSNTSLTMNFSGLRIKCYFISPRNNFKKTKIEIEKKPVSYSYGSIDECISVKSNFIGEIISVFEVNENKINPETIL